MNNLTITLLLLIFLKSSLVGCASIKRGFKAAGTELLTDFMDPRFEILEFKINRLERMSMMERNMQAYQSKIQLRDHQEFHNRLIWVEDMVKKLAKQLRRANSLRRIKDGSI